MLMTSHRHHMGLGLVTDLESGVDKVVWRLALDQKVVGSNHGLDRSPRLDF
jgi:hypothetical protein